MRYYLSLLIAVVLLAGVFTTNAMAQGMMRMTPEERVKQMKDSLGLNDQQTDTDHQHIQGYGCTAPGADGFRQ